MKKLGSLLILLMHSKTMHLRIIPWLLYVNALLVRNALLYAVCALFSTIAYTADNTLYATFSLHNHNNGNAFTHLSHNRAAIRQYVKRPHSHSSPIPNLSTYSSHQLACYFADHEYTENAVLSQSTLYMSDEFVKTAKTYQGYASTIVSLHKRIHRLGFWGKLWHWIHGEYCPGLDRRIKSLYTEIQKSKTNNHHQSIHKQQTTIALPQSQQQLISVLESDTNQAIVVETIDQLSKQVFNQAEYYRYPIDTQIEETIDVSLDILRTTSNPDEFIFHTAFVDHILCNIEEHTTQNTHSTLLERSPKLLMQALTTFVKGLNPVTQVKNTCEFIISTAHFVADVTLGKLYLSEQQYNNRINNFWSLCETLSPSNLARLEAEQWVDLIAQCAADCVFLGSIGKAVSYLKEIEAVSKAQKQATRIARKLKHAIDASLAEQPLFVTAEGFVLRATDDMKQLGGAAKEVITNSRALLESTCNGLLADLTKEIDHLRTLFDGKVKGFAEFANKYIKIDYKHILGMELKFGPNETLSKINGFHHDIMNCLEKSGVVEFGNKVVYENGFYKAILLHNGNVVKKVATFFPAHWPRKKVIETIYNAYNNFLKSGIQAELKKGKYLIRGLTNEGITIEMYITQNGHVVTAYPLL